MTEYNFAISAAFSVQGNIDNLSAAVTAQVTTNTLLSTRWELKNVWFTFQNPLTPEEAGQIYAIIIAMDPESNPIGIEMFTYANAGTLRATFNGNTIGYLGERSNEIHISKDTQCKYNTIRAALDNETADNLVFIVHPGAYTENNPLVLRTGCSLTSDCNFENVTITASNPNSNLVVMGSKCLVKGLTLIGATGACGIYFDASAGGGAGYVSGVQECSIKNCNTAIESDGKNGNGMPDTLFCEKVKITPTSQNLQYGLYAHAKGQIVSSILGIFGIPGYFTIGTGVYVADDGSKISISQNSIWFLGKAMAVNNGGELEIVLVTAAYNNIGLEIGTTGTTSKLSAASMGFKNSIQYDINVLPTDAIVQIHSGVVDDTKINNPNKLTLNAVYHLVRYGKYYQSMTGNVLLGSSREPSKFYAGEGHYDIDHVYVLTNDNLETGTFADVTDNALSDGSPPFNMFAGVGAGNCLYVGRQLNVVGFKTEVLTAVNAPVLRGDLVYEYWNGSTWVAFNTCAFSSTAPYYTPNNEFCSAVDTYQLNFGLTSATPFAVKVINGKSAKWIRIRVANALPSVPVIQMLKPHPSSSEIDSDGFIKHFGDSRTVRKIPLEYSDSLGTVNPGDQSLYVSSNLYSKQVKNSFATGVLNGVSFTTTLPRNIDSSFPLKISVCFAGSSGTAGNVFWRIRYACIEVGEQLYNNGTDAPGVGTDEQSVTLVQAVTAAGTTVVSDIKIPITHILVNRVGAGQTTLFLSIERDGTNGSDTYTGNANVYDMSLWGISWCEGTHLLGF